MITQAVLTGEAKEGVVVWSQGLEATASEFSAQQKERAFQPSEVVEDERAASRGSELPAGAAFGHPSHREKIPVSTGDYWTPLRCQARSITLLSSRPTNPGEGWG